MAVGSGSRSRGPSWTVIDRHAHGEGLATHTGHGKGWGRGGTPPDLVTSLDTESVGAEATLDNLRADASDGLCKGRPHEDEQKDPKHLLDTHLPGSRTDIVACLEPSV